MANINFTIIFKIYDAWIDKDKNGFYTFYALMEWLGKLRLVFKRNNEGEEWKEK